MDQLGKVKVVRTDHRGLTHHKAAINTAKKCKINTRKGVTF
jgi:hypothetical protein